MSQALSLFCLPYSWHIPETETRLEQDLRKKEYNLFRILGFKITHQKHARAQWQQQNTHRNNRPSANASPGSCKVTTDLLNETQELNSHESHFHLQYWTLRPKSASNLTATLTVLVKLPSKRLLKSPLYRNLKSFVKKGPVQIKPPTLYQ